MTGPLHGATSALVAQIAAAPAFVARCLLSQEQPETPAWHIRLDEALVTEGGEAYSNTMDKLRPFVVIVEGEDGFQSVSQGTSVGMVGGGSLYVLFTDVAREKDDPALPNASKLDFVSFVSETLKWISLNNGKDPYLYPWSAITQVESYTRSPLNKRKQTDHWTAVYSFSYGTANA